MRENEQPATCVAEGSYEAVVYCSECGEELSRERVSTPLDPTNHAGNDVVGEVFDEDEDYVYYKILCSACDGEKGTGKMTHDDYQKLQN